MTSREAVAIVYQLGLGETITYTGATPNLRKRWRQQVGDTPGGSSFCSVVRTRGKLAPTDIRYTWTLKGFRNGADSLRFEHSLKKMNKKIVPLRIGELSRGHQQLLSALWVFAETNPTYPLELCWFYPQHQHQQQQQHQQLIRQPYRQQPPHQYSFDHVRLSRAFDAIFFDHTQLPDALIHLVRLYADPGTLPFPLGALDKVWVAREVDALFLQHSQLPDALIHLVRLYCSPGFFPFSHALSERVATKSEEDALYVLATKNDENNNNKQLDTARHPAAEKRQRLRGRRRRVV